MMNNCQLLKRWKNPQGEARFLKRHQHVSFWLLSSLLLTLGSWLGVAGLWLTGYRVHCETGKVGIQSTRPEVNPRVVFCWKQQRSVWKCDSKMTCQSRESKTNNRGWGTKPPGLVGRRSEGQNKKLQVGARNQGTSGLNSQHPKQLLHPYNPSSHGKDRFLFS